MRQSTALRAPSIMAEMSQPRCLLLAGPSSAGKTSLARAFQRAAPEPWFLFEGDIMSAGFPRVRPEFVTREWDRRVREACARGARGMLEAGLNVVVELGLFDPWGRSTIASVLAAFPTFVIRVRCDLATLEQRENARGDRFAGTARTQQAALDGLVFDYDVVTEHLAPDRLAHDLTHWLASDPSPGAVYALLGDQDRATVPVRDLGLADAPGCDAVLATLPYFFGQPAGIADCARAVRSQPGLVALDPAGDVIGFLTYLSHHPSSAEITWMAVRHDHRRRGVGRTLLAGLESRLFRLGVKTMFVITLGPSAAEPDVSDSYAGTRAFYQAAGFVPLRELEVWGPDSPGLVLAFGIDQHLRQ